MALINKLNNIGDAIRAKTGKEDKLTLEQMVTEISNITTGGGELPDEAFVITGDCNYKFAYTGWNWFIENYGSQITTENITNLSNMFYGNNKLTEIPFEINCEEGTAISCERIFNLCDSLTSIPKINNCTPSHTAYMFYGCQTLKNIPSDIADWFDWNNSNMDANTSGGYKGNRSNMFYNCRSLRSIPMDFLAHGNPFTVYSYSIYNSGFGYCYSLDEIVGLPLPHLSAAWTSNAFGSCFTNCGRLKNMTFALQEDGTPYTAEWKNQVIDLTTVGWQSAYSNGTSYGFTKDTYVSTDATYAALKDNPDWWSTSSNYSRYNHDSAVATINSLPDTSAYLASAGGTNTIKFTGAAGSKTDGGAISTLTEEEIAVAAAKGWTVTLV